MADSPPTTDENEIASLTLAMTSRHVVSILALTLYLPDFTLKNAHYKMIYDKCININKIEKQKWAIPAAAIAIGYGLVDKAVQSFIPTRRGSLVDVGVDTAGVLTALAILALGGRKKKAAESSRRKKSPLSGFLFLKRPFDVILSLIGIVISLPLSIIFAFLIWIEDRGPVFYRQERVGKKGRLFKTLKFRSMIKDAEKDGDPVQAVENDPRVTRIGRLLRATAMDELPQLVNIFKGEMSFVGPRALRPVERDVQGNPDSRKIQEVSGYYKRQAVRPGLTGLAQVYLPKDAPRRKKFRHDSLYIYKQSFWLDLKIMALSFWITFRGKWESRQQKI